MTSKVIEGHKSSSNFSVYSTLPNTLIYESILINIYINANIMNTQLFHLNKYIRPLRSLKVTKVHPILALT